MKRRRYMKPLSKGEVDCYELYIYHKGGFVGNYCSGV